MREGLLKFMSWLLRVPYHPPAPGPFDRITPGAEPAGRDAPASAGQGSAHSPPSEPRADRL